LICSYLGKHLGTSSLLQISKFSSSNWLLQTIKNKHQSVFLLLLDFGISRLTSLQFIQYQVVGFYKLTSPQSPPSHLRDYSTCQVRVFPQVMFQALIQMNGAWQMISIVCIWTQDLSVMSLLPFPLDLYHGYLPNKHQSLVVDNDIQKIISNYNFFCHQHQNHLVVRIAIRPTCRTN